MARRTGLGRGLDALIPGSSETSASVIKEIGVDQISPNPRQPRKQIDPESLNELADSIRQHGILQPLIVSYESSTPGKYILVAGHRRLAAAQHLGLASVPAIVREVGEQQRLELALVENIQRADLSPLDQAEAFQQLVDDFGLPHEDIARQVGKSRAAITNTLRLLKLPADVRLALEKSEISEGHARALLALKTPLAQISALETIVKNALNVRQTEELVRRLNGQRPEPKVRRVPTAEVQDLENRLRDRLGTKVSVNQRGKGGTLVIYYYSDEELDNIIQLVLES
jgi:ParB family transcriptional regulator, chromosome partitioning protein